VVADWLAVDDTTSFRGGLNHHDLPIHRSPSRTHQQGVV
jgi:hypothetical protein